MTEHFALDLFRLALGVALLALAAMVARLGWLRREFDDGVGEHWAAYASYAVALVILALLRVTHAGMPPTWDLWAAAVVAVAGWYAMMKRAKFHSVLHR